MTGLREINGMPTPVKFLPVDLTANFEKCLEFIRDAFVCSYGSLDKLDELGGPAGYRSGLQRALATFPETTAHVWRGEELVGQVELSIRHDLAVGFVNLFYLIPAVRGSGIGRKLHEYSCDVFRQHGLLTARLSVAPSNRRALKFYSKNGWRNVGPRADRPYVLGMELNLLA